MYFRFVHIFWTFRSSYVVAFFRLNDGNQPYLWASTPWHSNITRTNKLWTLSFRCKLPVSGKQNYSICKIYIIGRNAMLWSKKKTLNQILRDLIFFFYVTWYFHKIQAFSLAFSSIVVKWNIKKNVYFLSFIRCS